MLKIGILAAWAVILFTVNEYVLTTDWAQYAFTFVSAALMTALLGKTSRTKHGN